MNYSEPLICNSYYHIYNHAVGKENLFSQRENYIYFLSKYTEYISPVCRTFAYCLMPNHFHFLIQVKDESDILEFYTKMNQAASLKDQKTPDFAKIVMQRFSNFFNAYAKAYNKQYERKGALFIDYVKRKEIKDDSYFSKLIYYIHFNPVYHGFCKYIHDWEFSSFRSITSTKKTKLEKEKVLQWFGNKEHYLKFHNSISLLPAESEELEFQ